MEIEDLSISHDSLTDKLETIDARNKLFALPAQSNVTGIKHDLDWINVANDNGWDVLLDAAAFVPTSVLDLEAYNPAYVAISFYKIFGYPTGLGCLLIHNEAYHKLEKKWFAGGTVDLAAVKAPNHFLTRGHARFEDGTVNYLAIPAIKSGLEFMEDIGMQRLNERIDSLMSYLYQSLMLLSHSNGVPQVEIFGHPSRENTGGTMIMCFKNPDDTKIRFEKVEELANEKSISIRSGCFCNPGIDEINNRINTEELARYFENNKTGDYRDMIEKLNKMRGATRVSTGISTTRRDIDAFVSFISGLKDRIISS